MADGIRLPICVLKLLWPNGGERLRKDVSSSLFLKLKPNVDDNCSVEIGEIP